MRRRVDSVEPAQRAMRVLLPRTYRSDRAWRWRCTVPESLAHPAKMSAFLCRDLFLRYTQPGHIVLDPFLGIGTALLGVHLGRHVIGVELEPRFAALAQLNAQRMREQILSAHPLGSALVLRGDSRQLPLPSAGAVVTLPATGGTSYPETREREQWRSGASAQVHVEELCHGGVDAALTSPPYVDARGDWATSVAAGNIRYGAVPGQIGNLAQGDVDAVLASPPYGDVASRDRSNEAYCQTKDTALRRRYGAGEMNRHIDGYGGALGQIGDLRHEGMAGIVNSPPYADALSGDAQARRRSKAARVSRGAFVAKRPDVCLSPTNLAASGVFGGYSLDPANTGNLPLDEIAAVGTLPYAGSLPNGHDDRGIWGGDSLARAKKEYTDYGRADGQTGDLPAGGGAAAQASPPYVEARHQARQDGHPLQARGLRRGVGGQLPTSEDYSLDGRSIGELRHYQGAVRGMRGPASRRTGETYAQAMFQVYRECHRVVRPGGVLVLVVGNYVRGGRVVDLAADTIRLAQAANWTPVERWVHAKANVSFLRRLHHQQAVEQGREPVGVTEEHVLVFVKGLQGWEWANLPPTTRAPAVLTLKRAAARQLTLEEAAG